MSKLSSVLKKDRYCSSCCIPIGNAFGDNGSIGTLGGYTGKNKSAGL